MEEASDLWHPQKIALVAAAIGALTAIVTQLLVHYLIRNRTNKAELRNLIGEERRLSYLIEQYNKEVVMYKTHKQYWYKLSTLNQYTEEQKNDSHKRHIERNEKSFEAITKAQSATAEYFKIITQYLSLKGENKIIEDLLNQLKEFKPRKASSYDGINNPEELFTAQDKDEDELNIEYQFYTDTFLKIYNQMKK